jgi:hypothetical protein
MNPVGGAVVLILFVALLFLPARLPWAVMAAWRGSWRARGEVGLLLALSAAIWTEFGPFAAIWPPGVVILAVALARFARRVTAVRATLSATPAGRAD